MKRFVLKPIITVEGKEYEIAKLDAKPEDETKTEKGNVKNCLRLFAYNLDQIAMMQRKTFNLTDSTQAALLLRNIKDSKDGELVLEDEPYKWVIKQMDDYGPAIFGLVHASTVKEALDDFERLHEPKAKDSELVKELDKALKNTKK